MERRTVTVEEAGKALGISRCTAYKLAGNGTLPVIRIGRLLKVPIGALDRMLESANTKAKHIEVN